MASLYLSGLGEEQKAQLRERLLETQQGTCYICDEPIDLVIHFSLLSVVAHGATLDLEGENAVARVREDEVGFALLGSSALARQLPGDRVKGDHIIWEVITEAFEEAPLGSALGLDGRLRDHPSHRRSSSAARRLSSSACERLPTCHAMPISDDNTLDRELLELAAGTVRQRRQANLVARCMEAALATTADDRTWALVRLAADLRVLERYDEALFVLDTAWLQLEASEHAELAMFTCAIAIHCDREDLDIALKLERDLADRPDLKFARACLRLYTDLCGETEDDLHRARRELYRSLVETLEVGEQSIAA
jgi:hypothetical protein